jgi:hypothetical protein
MMADGLAKEVRIRRVSDIDWSRVRPGRAGVIIYTDLPNGRRFCLGVDRTHHDLTDFGGGVSYKKDGTALNGALRELKEESLEIFGSMDPDDNRSKLAIPIDHPIIQSSLAIYNSSLLIVFVRVVANPLTVTQLFRDRVHPNSEVSAMVWITPAELQAMILGTSSLGRMYNRVRRLLAQAGRFWDFL